MKLFEKVLIANRGEIALRILRACKELGIKTVAVHSSADESCKHVRLADESVCIGPPSSKDSYLKMSAIISAAEITGADAIHPGFGFLSENAIFAQMIEEHGITFIGPAPQHITMMGDKITAKKTMIELGVPVVPGTEGAVTVDNAVEWANKIGYPVIIKATSGGGGKGMKVATSDGEVVNAVRLAGVEAKANFGNDEVYMERYLRRPRHIEIQVVGDTHGNVANLGERDCSIQRRHQKIWEEAPSPALTSEQRSKLGDIVNQAIKKMGYRGVGTLEFLFEDGEFFFMEMNTRIQVEHPVTEGRTGVDLISEQIRHAQGDKVRFKQSDIIFRNHVIEFRINAEDPRTGMPSPGHITHYHRPGGIGVRTDDYIYTGYTVPPYYDSMVSKIIVQADNRANCITRAKRVLNETVVSGIQTNINLHKQILDDPDFVESKFSTNYLSKKLI